MSQQQVPHPKNVPNARLDVCTLRAASPSPATAARERRDSSPRTTAPTITSILFLLNIILERTTQLDLPLWFWQGYVRMRTTNADSHTCAVVLPYLLIVSPWLLASRLNASSCEFLRVVYSLFTSSVCFSFTCGRLLKYWRQEILCVSFFPRASPEGTYSSDGAGCPGEQPKADTAEASKYKLLLFTRPLSHSYTFSIFLCPLSLLGETLTTDLDRPHHQPQSLTLPPADSPSLTPSSSPTANQEPSLATGSDTIDGGSARWVSSPLTSLPLIIPL